MEYCVIQDRRCYKCDTVKPVDEFYKDKTSKYGIQAACKVCTKQHNAKWKAEHPDYHKQKGKERYQRSENRARYQRYRDQYLERAKLYRSTVQGRGNHLLSSARQRAKTKGIGYTLSVEWFLTQAENQDYCCALTGLALDFDGKNTSEQRQYNPLAPSLDRIDPAQGYTPENTRLVCTAINIGLNGFGEDMYRQVAEAYLAKNPRP